MNRISQDQKKFMYEFMDRNFLLKKNVNSKYFTIQQSVELWNELALELNKMPADVLKIGQVGKR